MDLRHRAKVSLTREVDSGPLYSNHHYKMDRHASLTEKRPTVMGDVTFVLETCTPQVETEAAICVVLVQQTLKELPVEFDGQT